MTTPLNKRMATLLISLAFLASACSSSNYDILSFFFDGVPNPNEQKVETVEVEIDSSKFRTREEILKRANPKFVLHGPYRAKLCDDCHNMESGFRLLKKEPELCYKCHDSFEKTAKVLHGPVASGYCTECHHPHRSKNEYLLLEPAWDLCLKCHDENDIKANEDHPDIEGENCIDCHDPHGNNEQYFLR